VTLDRPASVDLPQEISAVPAEHSRSDQRSGPVQLLHDACARVEVTARLVQRASVADRPGDPPAEGVVGGCQHLKTEVRIFRLHQAAEGVEAEIVGAVEDLVAAHVVGEVDTVRRQGDLQVPAIVRDPVVHARAAALGLVVLVVVVGCLAEAGSVDLVGDPVSRTVQLPDPGLRGRGSRWKVRIDQHLLPGDEPPRGVVGVEIAHHLGRILGVQPHPGRAAPASIVVVLEAGKEPVVRIEVPQESDPPRGVVADVGRSRVVQHGRADTVGVEPGVNSIHAEVPEHRLRGGRIDRLEAARRVVAVVHLQG
jgi:hypothetical protein